MGNQLDKKDITVSMSLDTLKTFGPVTHDAGRNMIFMGGSDEKGLFVCWGPILRLVYAVMMQTDDVWSPYKMYKNIKLKTLKRAKQHLSFYKSKYTQSFKIEIIWESVPIEELEKTYYEDTEKVIVEIERRTGRPRRGIILGLGRNDRECGPVILAEHGEKIKQVLTSSGEEGCTFRVVPAPDK